MFIGYPRSGHSLVGALLDAHPDAVVAHELDAIRYLRARFRRTQIFALILEKSRADAAAGRVWGDYAYAVGGQWQGRHRRLRVIGDKKGGRSTRQLIRAPELLDRLRTTVRVPVRLVHVVRNPFDNIATMHRRAPDTPLAGAIEEYFTLAAGVGAIRSSAGDVLDVEHEAFIERPVEALAAVCDHLGLERDEQYLNACAAIVRPAPHPSRTAVAWDNALVAEVHERAAAFDFLAGYRWEV